MKDRPQVNIRLERDLLSEIDSLAEADRVDRSEMARRLLSSGLSSYRMERALAEYRRGNVTAWRAASLAGVSLYEMLDRIHEAGIPYEVDPELFDRLDARTNSRAAVHEEPARYDAVPADAGSGIAKLREQFKPERVTTLFVGESSPAGGTHFYRANSNLFRATQEAFAKASAEDVPLGPRFLHWFRDQGCWLVDLADRPVNRLADSERESAVLAGVVGLAALIRGEKPDRIVAVKASIAGAVREAAARADHAGKVVELPFPVRQWREVFINRLAGELRGGTDLNTPTRRSRSSEQSTPTQTQRVTAVDFRRGQIRIPITGAVKELLPNTKTQVSVDLRGRKLDASYDPRFGPDKERSGVLRVGSPALRELVQEDERLNLTIEADGSIRLA